MSVIEIALLGVSLAMDAFAVSITTGITLKDLRWKHALRSVCSLAASSSSCP